MDKTAIILDLPNELQYEIMIKRFNFDDLKMLCNVALRSKSEKIYNISEVCNDELFWKQKTYYDFPEASQELRFRDNWREEYEYYLTQALIWAAINNDEERVKELILFGADPNEYNDYGDSPLIAAAREDSVDAARVLVSNNADVNIVDSVKNTPLIFASVNGNLEMAKLLVENGAKVNAVSETYDTPLIYAAENGHYDVVVYLVENKADIMFHNKYNDYAISIAATPVIRDFLKNKLSTFRRFLLQFEPPRRGGLHTVDVSDVLTDVY